MLTKSVTDMTFSLAYVLSIAFVALYHINDIRRRAGDVMSLTSFFVDREKTARCGSLCNERTRLAPITVTAESARSQGACLRCLVMTNLDLNQDRA